MDFFIFGAENPSMQTRDIIDFVRLCHFPPAQLESCKHVKKDRQKD